MIWISEGLIRLEGDTEGRGTGGLGGEEEGVEQRGGWI